ncbi:MAG: hypothetical protein N2578_07155, partial [Bdellovibrionaceae bacterium]|nr:hypothetical protein [Pseudobdellovibrionaceae bacterium]
SGEPPSTQSLEPTPETQQGSSNSDSLGLDSVVEYANSLENQSPVTYSITIRGLDLAEHLQSVRDALTDSKFGWDTGELMSKVNNGELILSNLSPLVTVVLVNRIKYLPVELSWSQEVFANEK